MTWDVLILAIAAGLNIAAIGIELLLHDREKAKSVEFAIRRKQREMKELQKKKDTKAMMQANKELMGLMSQNFRLRMKTMFISFPLFIVLIWVLNGMLTVAPLEAGAVSMVGADVRNLATTDQALNLELVSSGVQVSGQNVRMLELKNKGDHGDMEQIWWNVTAAVGPQTYSIKVSADNDSDETSYNVRFVPAGSLTADFAPQGASELLDGSVELKPLYRGVDINVLGIITMSWFWYYFFSYLILSLILSPLKNQLLWGHRKGIKYLEKLDHEKGKTEQ